MTTYYALPALTAWSATPSLGWSLSSGGSAVNVSPSTSDDVIFDGNSGSARTITVSGAATCRDLTASGTLGIAFSSTITPARNVSVSGDYSFQTLHLDSGSHSLSISPTVSIQNIRYGSSATMTLAADLYLETTFLDNANTGNSTINAAGFSVSLAYFAATNTGNFTLGAGVWTVRSGDFNLNGATSISAASATLKFAGTSAQQTCTFPTSATLGTLWNANTYSNADPKLAGLLTGSSALLTISTLRLDTSVITVLASGQTLAVSSVSLNAESGLGALYSSSSGTSATLHNQNAATKFLDRLSINRITATGGAWSARNSTDVGSNTGITFVARTQPRQFLNFF